MQVASKLRKSPSATATNRSRATRAVRSESIVYVADSGRLAHVAPKRGSGVSAALGRKTPDDSFCASRCHSMVLATFRPRWTAGVRAFGRQWFTFAPAVVRWRDSRYVGPVLRASPQKVQTPHAYPSLGASTKASSLRLARRARTVC